MAKEPRNKCDIVGYIYGTICADLQVYDPLVGGYFYAVPSSAPQVGADSMGQYQGAEAKRVIATLSQEDLKERTAREKAFTGRIGDTGMVCIDADDYDGTPLDIYVCMESIPTPGLEPPMKPLPEPQCLWLGTIYPRAFDDIWYFSIYIPAQVWCQIRALADAWVIAGRAVTCDGAIPLGGVTVTAFDVDIIQHDNLGSDVTNAGGIFRIDYPGSAYRQGTILDIELFGGPDVYFLIEDADGNKLLEESSARGRTSGRENIGHCFCIELCADIRPEHPYLPGIWTGIGTAFTIPDASDLNDFDADGYAGAAKYAFTGTIRMTGSAPTVGGSGYPMEYRFLVSDTTAPNGDPPVAEANFTKVVGVGAGASLFAATRVGQMIRYSPFKIVNVYATLSDLDAEGWFDVNQAIQRTFTVHPILTPADIPTFEWVDLDGLMAIDTRQLTTASNVPGDAAEPGDPVPGGNLIGIESKAIRFEIREVIDKAANLFVYLPSSGTTLNQIVLNNNPPFMAISTVEHLTIDKCAPLSGAVELAYTVHHPHIRNVNINVRSNDNAYNVNQTDASTGLPIANNTSPTLNHVHNNALPLTTPPSPHKCSYLVSLSVLRRLHTGDGAVDANWRQITFYFEP